MFGPIFNGYLCLKHQLFILQQIEDNLLDGGKKIKDFQVHRIQCPQVSTQQNYLKVNNSFIEHIMVSQGRAFPFVSPLRPQIPCPLRTLSGLSLYLLSGHLVSSLLTTTVICSLPSFYPSQATVCYCLSCYQATRSFPNQRQPKQGFPFSL